MADKKISALDAIVAIDDADVLPIVDASVSTTKKINVSQVKALAPVQSVASKTGAVTLVKGDVGLGNVDNTADADKPVSTATQTALNAKQDTLVSGTNIKTINSTSILGSGDITISGSVAWGGITGTLSSQTDLQSALDGKEATITAGTTAQYYRGDKSFQTLDKTAVGLANVDNTSDANKPISTATQTALDAKEPTITAGTTSQYYRGDKSFQTLDKTAVGLSNVDNTSDANKPVSTATQTALDGKTDKLITQNNQTGTTYTLVLSDADKLVDMNNASANTLTIPPNSSVAFSTGTQIIVVQKGAGTTTIAAGSGVTLLSKDSALGIGGQYGAATCIKIATDTWYVIGDLA